LEFQNSFLEHITVAKIFRNKLPVICKNKAPKYYFLPSKLKLGHKNLFDSYKSSKTHTGDKKAISISQNHMNTRSLGDE